MTLAVFSALGKSNSDSFVTSNVSNLIKNTVCSKAVVFCACEITLLLYAVFYVVRSDHKLDFRLVTNKTPNKWRSV